MKLANQIISYLVGGLFIFSGLIKLNDPRGLEIKLEEYFEVFAQDKAQLGLASLSGLWQFFEPYSLWLGVILSVLEVVLGLHVIIKYRYRASLWTLLGMIVFFTFLTFYSAYFNKVTDCGCFGDFIKLTPWTSFGKDVLLLVLLSYLLFQKEKSVIPTNLHFGASIGSFIISFGIAYWAIEHLPFFDFRPYKIGSNIPNNMKPSGEPIYGKQQFTYLNKKTGKDESAEKFQERWKDTTTYKYKSFSKPLLNPEINPKITDYRVTSADGQDWTKKTLEGKKLLIIVQDLKKTNAAYLKKMNALGRALEGKKIETILITSAGIEDFDKFRHEHQISIPYSTADKVVLKTMIRSNPGLMYLENGTVKNMWHYNDTPTEKAF